MESFFTLARKRRVVWPAVKVALVVGSVLALINHGPAMLSGSLIAQSLAQIFLTYLVPYGVSTYSAVRAIQVQTRMGDTTNEH